MRVLLLSHQWPPVGGQVGITARQLALGLVRHGAEVDVVAMRPHPLLARRDAANDPMIPGLSVHRVRSWPPRVRQVGRGGTGGYVVRALPVARRLLRARRYDVVHAFYAFPTGALLPLLPLGDAAAVLSLRGADVPTDGTRDRRRRVAPLHHAARWLWRRPDALVASSEAVAARAGWLAGGVEVDVIRDGVDLELFRRARKEPAGDGDPLRCVAVAPLVERKAVDDLLRAWALLERGRFRLEVVGMGKQETRLRRLAHALGLGNDVVFTGPLDPEQTAGRYREADVFVLCPRVDAEGTVFAHALASGLPVVASPVGAVPELVVNGVNGLLVPVGDSEAIAAAVRRLGEHPEQRDRMAAASRARAEELLAWKRMRDGYRHLYRSLAISRRRLSTVPLVVRPGGRLGRLRTRG